MNPLEHLTERVVGYPVDWSATGTWAQLQAAFIALRVASSISRSEMRAQRQVAADERGEFAGVVVGICEIAANFIYDASRILRSRDEVETLAHGYGSDPTAASIILALRGLDLNRMPNAQAAMAVTELGRLCGWTKSNCRTAKKWYSSDVNLPPDFIDAMDEWRDQAQEQWNNVRAGFAKAADANRKLLKGGPRIRILKR